MNSLTLSCLVYCFLFLPGSNAYNPARHNNQEISTIDLIHHSYKDLFPDIKECCPVAVVTADLDEFPQVVLLHYVNANGSSSFPCSGTLISKSHVLTAAHCVTGSILKESGELTYIRLGVHNLSNPTCVDKDCQPPVIDSKIASVVFHRNFNESIGQHDIALVRLEEPIMQFTSNIQPICLRWVHKPTAEKVSAGHNFTMLRWGRTPNSKSNLVDNKLELTLFDHDQCEEKYAQRNITITGRQLCAVRNSTGNEDDCQADSGGPLISNVDNCLVLEGVVSFEKGCGLKQWPGIYTDVMSYRRWILRHMKK